MYKQNKIPKTTLNVNESYEGEPIETKIQRIVENKEPIKDGAPIIWTPRKDGVKPEHDIRTDRFEIATETMDKVGKSHIARRQERHKELGEKAKEGMKKEGETGGQSTEGTTQ